MEISVELAEDIKEKTGVLRELKKRAQMIENYNQNLNKYILVAKKLLSIPAEFHSDGWVVGVPFFETLGLPISPCQKRDIMVALDYKIVAYFLMRPYRRKSYIYSNRDHDPIRLKFQIYHYIAQFRALYLLN